MGFACPKSCHCSERNGLTVVQCSSRNIEEIPSDLPHDTVSLLLSSNHITKIPNQAFKNLPWLQELDLSRNAIETVDAGAFQGVTESLRVLDLSHNHMQSVPKEAFARLHAKISLSNNPWHCECTLQEVLRELRLDPETVNEVSCHTSVQEEYAGKPVIQVLDSGINFCNFHHKTTDVAMFVTMFGWFTMVIAYVIYYMKKQSPLNLGWPVDPKKEKDYKPGGSDNRPVQDQTPNRDCEQPVRPVGGYQKFLKGKTSKLIQKVKNVDSIIDDLPLHDESVANVRAKPTNQEKMRKLLDCVNCESIAKDLFNALYEHEKGLMDELLQQ
ncbi:hypothetical protein Q8A67_006567 [Cirrhinus molitorella]|uniref:Leucine-rich repeat-containing protein 3 n=1 Tax=Cirrhinus molitorella TaxID=172907 RepID=A0AA88U1D9_9TELE|nr:hypothetical protein Q8A67_006567 [Cirrhinus molitorella]